MILTAALNPDPTLVSLAGTMAPLASVGLFLAPMPTIRHFMKEKTVGNLPLLPHTTMLSNAFLWVTYGALRHEPSICATNGVGIMFSIFYFVQFSRYAPQISKTLPGTKQIHIHASMATMLSIAALAILLPEHTAATIVGDLGVAFVMMLNASPLVAIKTVIDEKSADSIPLSFTLASIACCFFWSIVGLEQLHDWVVYFPNMMGLCFGLVQLGLKLMYSNVDDETFACSQGSLASKEIAM